MTTDAEGGMEGVECYREGRRWLSKANPTRCVQEVLSGWACYEREGDTINFLHRGITDQSGAYDWLNGAPRDEIKNLLKVHGVTLEDGTFGFEQDA